MAGSFRRTLIQTVDRASGAVIKQEVEVGAPFLMNRDIVIAKRVFRMATKLHGRLPRRSVKRRVVDCPPGINSFLEGRALTRALCPPERSC